MLWSRGYCYFCLENNFPSRNYDYTLKSSISTWRILSSLRPMSSSDSSAWGVFHKPPHLSPTVDAGHQFRETPADSANSQTRFSTSCLGLSFSPLSVLLLSVQVACFTLPFLSSSHRAQCTMFPSNFDLGASRWHSDAPRWPCFLISWALLVIQD